MVLLSVCGSVAVTAIACVGSDVVSGPSPTGGDGSSSGGSSGGDALPPEDGGDGSLGSTSSSGSTDSGTDAPPGPCRQATGAPLPNDLIAQWPFQNADLVDITGMHTQAIAIGTLGRDPDRFLCANSALSLGGSGVELGKPKANAITTAFTIQLWVRWIGSQNDARIFGNEQTATGSDNGTVILYHNKNNLVLSAVHSTSSATLTFTGFAEMAWHQIVLTVATNRAQLFVDGQLRDTEDFTGLSMAVAVTRSWRLGMVTGGGSPFAGSIDDVRIYSKALGDTDVMTLYKEYGWPP